jgi:hypothetical protein
MVGMRKGAAERVFLDWTQPLLAASADRLIARFAAGQRCDLQRIACILPTARAGRILLAMLVERCRAARLWLTPPRILTPGRMIDAVFPASIGIATTQEQVLAWASVLQRDRGRATGHLVSKPPPPRDVMAWHDLGARIVRAHEELSGEARSFMDAAACADRMGLDREGDRWRALADLAETYQQVLQSAGLTDPHDHRRRAIEGAALSADPGDTDQLILIGVFDLNGVQRQFVHALGDRVMAFVHAPAAWAGRFDDIGCLQTRMWLDDQIRIDSAQIHFVDRPEDQAREVMRALGAIGDAFGPDEVTIGLGDAALGPVVARQARWAGLSVHDAAGIRLARTPPAHLLTLAADWLDEPRFAMLAALVRHPDVERALRRRAAANDADADAAAGEWTGLLDRYFSDHLHQRLSGAWLGDPERQRRLAWLHDAVESLMAPLRTGNGAASSFDTWIEPIMQVLEGVYSNDETERPALASAALAAIEETLATLAAAPSSLQPLCHAATALRLALRAAGDHALADEPRRDQIEMLGWLELHLDPAPRLIVMGVNDGAIPAALIGDAFLPESLRTALGLVNNDRRYARDSYILQAILASRPETTLIAGRRSQTGEPLTPSRLLLACERGALVQRVREMLGGDRASSPAALSGFPPPDPKAVSGFIVPRLPADLPQPAHLRVTDFKTYLDCPYRFALSRLLGLRRCSDAALELDPRAFGALAHEALRVFGQDTEARTLTSAARIESFLLRALRDLVQNRYGHTMLPAVRVQVARLEERLRAFAERQAAWAREGWRILHSELDFEGHPPLDVPGQPPMPLYARIDRIDVHEGRRCWRILDYKTGESGDLPEQQHNHVTSAKRKHLDWFDLQLPLYHYLATRGGTGIDGSIELGYIVLPRDPADVDVHLARWTPEQLTEALERARAMVTDIRAGRFEMNRQFEAPVDDFARLCHRTILRDDDEFELDKEEPG